MGLKFRFVLPGQLPVFEITMLLFDKSRGPTSIQPCGDTLSISKYCQSSLCFFLEFTHSYGSPRRLFRQPFYTAL